MPGGLFSIPFIVLIVLLNSCTPGTQSQLIKKGQPPLSAEQLFVIVANNSLRLEAIDFDAILYFQKNGALSAVDRLKNKDTGNWDVTTENELCLKFRIWYYGDSKCYSVFRGQDSDSFLFFTKNGAKYYSAEYIAADPHNLAKQMPETDNKHFLRKDLAQKAQTDGGSNSLVPSSPLPAPAPTSPKTEKYSDIATLARNCPDCNLTGVNLTKTRLIGANLAGANLSGADLSGANLRRANLTGANLAGAKCIATNFAGAILVDSNLTNADLTGSNLIKAKLNGATIDGAIFSGAHLEGIEGYK
ncbi:MAG: pentapeptide repeat-containing protein [Desulfobulbaceae bacterium]|nr:pentapeptide repeat-containing protein [Desulfobulbaceae bacterium]